MKVDGVLELTRQVEMEYSCELDWLRSKLKGNALCTDIKDIDFSTVYVGNRIEDQGLIIGYPADTGGLLDLGLLAVWWVSNKRDPVKADIIKLMYGTDFYEPIKKAFR